MIGFPDGVETSMTTIGLIGAGNIGGTVARLAVNAGYDVVLSNSRGPETLAGLVSELGPHASAATAAEAGERGDLVVVTIPLKNYRDIPVEPLAGKVVMDTDNYYFERDGHIAELDDESTTSSELHQDHLPTSKVVKVFNNIMAATLLELARPHGAEDRSAMAIAGDDEAAKATVADFLDAIGYDTVDAGALAEGWRFQRDTAAYGLPYGTEADVSVPQPADVARIQQALGAAKRYRDQSA